MKKLGYILVNVILGIVIIFCISGTIAEKSGGFLGATIIFVVLLILNIKKHNNKISNSPMIKELDKKYISNDWQKIGHFENAYLYINEKSKKISTNGKEFDFKDLVSAEIIEDEKNYTNSYAKKGIGNSYYGSSSQTEFCTKLQIKLILNSIAEPQEYITFLNKRTWKSRKRYKQAYEMSQKFLSTLQVIVKNNSK